MTLVEAVTCNPVDEPASGDERLVYHLNLEQVVFFRKRTDGTYRCYTDRLTFMPLPGRPTKAVSRYVQEHMIGLSEEPT